MSTIFSNIPEDKWVMSNDKAFAILDIYPASEGHTLVIPKREIETFFELNDEELIAIKQLIVSRKEEISLADSTPPLEDIASSISDKSLFVLVVARFKVIILSIATAKPSIRQSNTMPINCHPPWINCSLIA